MRFTQSEKMEIIRLVQGSDLGVKRTLEELEVPRSSFYRWYRRYSEEGYEGLASRPPHCRRFWNKIPECEKRRVIDVALEKPELTPLSWPLRSPTVMVPSSANHRCTAFCAIMIW
jgi:putative transposase